MHYYIDNKTEEYKYTVKFFLQKVIDRKKQSLYYSYETLFHLLSAAENFAGLKNEQYQGYNISLATTYEELKSELVWELHCFQLSKKTYEKKYGKYIYPDGLPKEKILFDIKRYIERVNNENDKLLYYAMINIIMDEKINLNCDELFEDLEKTPDKPFNPSMISRLIGPLNNILNNIEKNVEDGKIKYEIKKNKSKSVEKIIKASQYNMNNNYLIGIIGSRINLQRISDNIFTFKYFFYNNYYNLNYKTQNYVTLKEPIQNGQKLYKCLIGIEQNHIDGYLYFFNENSTKNNIIYCALFNSNYIKNIKEQEFNFIDEDNKFGQAYLGNEKYYFLLIDNKNKIDDYK